MFRCQYCELETSHFKRLSRHYSEKHSALPYFSLKCIVEGCTCRYKSVNRLHGHIKSKHRIFYQNHLAQETGHHDVQDLANLNQDPGEIQDHHLEIHEDEVQDLANLNQDPGEIQNDPLEIHEGEARGHDDSMNTIKQEVAKSLLSIRELHKVPANISNAITEEIQKLVQLSQNEIYQHILETLKRVDINITDDLARELKNIPSVLSACNELNSQKKLETYVKETMRFVPPEEKVLGFNEKNKPETLQYVPLEMSLKNLLQYDDIFAEVMNGHQSRDGVLRDVVDGVLFREHFRFSEENKALALILYMDEFTVTNPLRVRSRGYKIMATYMTLANLPPEFRSQLHSIQLVSLCKSIHLKKYGLPAVLEDVLTDLRHLEENGIDVVTKDGEFHFAVELLLLIGDNLAQHQVGGFFESFQSNKSCRFCMVSKPDMKKGLIGPLRNAQTHDEHVRLVEETPEVANIYGVKKRSVFHCLGSFHSATSLPSDIGHDVFEGVAKTTVSQVVQHCVRHDYFTLQDLNMCISTFPYLGTDKVDKPSLINESHNVDVKQTMSQMWCLVRLLPLMVGTNVPEDDNAWEVLLMLLKAMEYICSPELRTGHIDVMHDIIQEFFALRLRTFPEYELRPKDHYILHYEKQMKSMGPLIQLWTLRMEAKHSYFLDVLKTCKCYKNASQWQRGTNSCSAHIHKEVIYSIIPVKLRMGNS